MNYSAQVYLTRSTVNDEGVHWENRRGQPEFDIVANICERCVIDAVCDINWYEVLANSLRSPNGEGGTGRVRLLSSQSGQASSWPRIAKAPLQGLKSAVAVVLCTRAGVSELLAHHEWGGSSFPSKKAFSSSRE